MCRYLQIFINRLCFLNSQTFDSELFILLPSLIQVCQIQDIVLAAFINSIVQSYYKNLFSQAMTSSSRLY